MLSPHPIIRCACVDPDIREVTALHMPQHFRSLARLVVCVILASSTTLGDDPCANMTVGAVKNGTAIPKIPMNAFSTDIRVIILNKNMTIDAKEYADEAMKAGALVMYFNGSRTTLILDYKNNQVYTFGSQAGTSDKNNDLCTATNMTADIDTQLFGGSNSSSGASMPHMFSTSRILQLANNSVGIPLSVIAPSFSREASNPGYLLKMMELWRGRHSGHLPTTLLPADLSLSQHKLKFRV
ncbi:hypothetical protein C0Q70_17187 [Pomacea canaliculata]|uniref:Uncharacterized protein n=1 Tax=Pomacea canaliculata TaxID=400727 RepID=A0A2T7NRW0_POMCA|nr:hypothetical protein C0Q70_17187 [Pomacea canaliculata]